MSEALIRPAIPADLDGLAALEAAAFAHDRATRRALRHAIRSQTITLLVAEVGGTVAGAALVERRRGAHAARLASVAVAPDWLGLGLGRGLLTAAEEDARARGVERLRLEVRSTNAAAIRLYEGAGYRRFAVVPGYYEDGAEAWRYEKALASPR